MVKTSSEDKKNKKEATETKELFLSQFMTRFNLDKFRDEFMFPETKEYEEKEIAKKIEKYKNKLTNKEHDEQEELKLTKMKPSDFEAIYPKSIQYIKDNIFPSERGTTIYMTYINDEGNTFPMELDKIEFAYYTDKFNPVLKYWVTHHFTNMYKIQTDLKKPRIYVDPKTGIKHLNIFNGYKFDSVEYDEELHIKRASDIKFVWDHLQNILCSGNLDIANECKKWICKLIVGKQKMETVIYLKGAQGIGKSKFKKLIMNTLGNSNCFTVKHADQVLKEFNGHFAGKVFACIEDVEFRGDNFKAFGDAMKNYITEDKLAFRDLFKKAVQMNNIVSLMIISNSDIGALNERAEGRRYIICDVSDIVKDSEYFDRLTNLCEKDEEFWRAFYMDCLKNYDSTYVESDSIKHLPMTKTKQAQIQHSMPMDIKFLKGVMNAIELEDPHKKSDFYSWFKDWFKENKDDLGMKTAPIQFDFLTNITKHTSFITVKNGRLDNMTFKDLIYVDRQKMIEKFRKMGYITDHDEIENDVELSNEDIISENDKKIKELLEQIDILKNDNIARKENEEKKPKKIKHIHRKLTNKSLFKEKKDEFDKDVDELLPTLSQPFDDVIDDEDANIITEQVKQAFSKVVV